jgi:hypothetical protein
MFTKSFIGGYQRTWIGLKLGRDFVRRYLLIHQVDESLDKMYMSTMSKVALKL